MDDGSPGARCAYSSTSRALKRREYDKLGMTLQICASGKYFNGGFQGSGEKPSMSIYIWMIMVQIVAKAYNDMVEVKWDERIETPG